MPPGWKIAPERTSRRISSGRTHFLGSRSESQLVSNPINCLVGHFWIRRVFGRDTRFVLISQHNLLVSATSCLAPWRQAGREAPTHKAFRHSQQGRMPAVKFIRNGRISYASDARMPQRCAIARPEGENTANRVSCECQSRVRSQNTCARSSPPRSWVQRIFPF